VSGAVSLGGGTALPGGGVFVRAESLDEVVDAVRRARAEGRRVRVTGAARAEDVPERRAWASGPGEGVPSLLLSTASLSDIPTYEPADLTVTAGAGTSLETLAGVLAPHRQWLPFDPPHVLRHTLGGLVASGASGPLAAGYGALRNHVLGATVVCGDGRVLHLGGRVVKNVAGFDLLRPWVGSLGRLGVITSVCVRLFPLPDVDRGLLLRAPTPGELVDAARAVATAGVLPASTVLARPVAGGEGLLLVRLHGAPATVEADQRTLERSVGEVATSVSGPELTDWVRDLPVGSVAGTTDRGASTAPPSGVGVAAASPSRLGGLLDALERTLGPVAFAADVHHGRVRFGFGPEGAPELPVLRSAVEALGGAVGVEHWPAAPVDGAVSEPSPGERALAERVRRVFDPHETMLP